MFARRLLSVAQRTACRHNSNVPAAPAAESGIVATAKPQATAAPPKVEKGGSTLMERLQSFLVGAAIGFGGGYALLHEEIAYSNERLDRMLVTFNERLKALESKK